MINFTTRLQIISKMRGVRMTNYKQGCQRVGWGLCCHLCPAAKICKYKKCRQLGHAPKAANTEIQTVRCRTKEDKDWLFAYLPQPCQLTSASWICLDDEDGGGGGDIKTEKGNFLFFCKNPETQRRWPKSFQRSGWRGLSKIFRSGRWYNYTITTHRICLSKDVLEREHTLLLLE